MRPMFRVVVSDLTRDGYDLAEGFDTEFEALNRLEEISIDSDSPCVAEAHRWDDAKWMWLPIAGARKA